MLASQLHSAGQQLSLSQQSTQLSQRQGLPAAAHAIAGPSPSSHSPASSSSAAAAAAPPHSHSHSLQDSLQHQRLHNPLRLVHRPHHHSPPASSASSSSPSPLLSHHALAVSPPSAPMSLPSSYINEIKALDREILKNKPSDVLQFCSNFFLRRLESQRAEYLLAQQHSAANGSGMAQSSFPGSNPFGHTGTTEPLSTNIHRLDEEDEADAITSPTNKQFPSKTAAPTFTMGSIDDVANAPADAGTFGNFDFNPDGGAVRQPQSSAGGARNTPPAASSAGFLDPNQSFPNNYNMNRRTSVSAESLNPASSLHDNWSPPYHQKTTEQQNRLKSAVAGNFLFSHLDDEQSTQVLGALQEKPIPARGIKVITQGDVGDYFYVVEAGSFDIHVNKSGKLEPGVDGAGDRVGAVGPGGSFGELALMYNAPRAATVVSTEPSTLWALDRVTFRRILMDSAFQRRRMYEGFLEEVPLLTSLTSYERSKIADALETKKYPAGTTIIKEGDVGESFYILESGAAEVYKSGIDKPVNSYKKGDYFGELALLNDAPRAASVISSTEVKVATLGKDGFQRLLGPVEGIMRRNDPSKASIHDEGVDPLSAPRAG